MKTLFKLLHIFVLAMFVINGNDIFDKVLSSVIAVIAYIYAFTLTRSLSDDLDYNSTLMSFVHWTVRTIISILMIFVSRIVYSNIFSSFETSMGNGSGILSITICVIIWIVIAEVLKSMTGLRKNY